jgi:hypothetical protein
MENHKKAASAAANGGFVVEGLKPLKENGCTMLLKA